MRHVIACIVDGSELLEFKPDHGPATVCGYAAIAGFRVGIVTNNGPLDPAGSVKVTHFVQSCCQLGIAIVWLQNTTGFIVGTEAERAGMIKHGSKQIQALANASVPQITVQCGASFGAGNYGMCGRGFGPRFVFSWPTATTAVMGASQAAGTMEIVMRDGAARKGEPVDEAKLAALKRRRSSRPSSASPTRSTPRACCSTTASSTRATRAASSPWPSPSATRRRGAPFTRCSSASPGPEPPTPTARPGAACNHARARRDPAHAQALHRRARSIRTSTSGRRPRPSRRTRSSRASASSACSA